MLAPKVGPEAFAWQRSAPGLKLAKSLKDASGPDPAELRRQRMDQLQRRDAALHRYTRLSTGAMQAVERQLSVGTGGGDGEFLPDRPASASMSFSRNDGYLPPRLSTSSSSGGMLAENPGTVLKRQLQERARKVALEKKVRFEHIMAEKAAQFDALQRQRAKERAKVAKARARVRKLKLVKVQAAQVADDQRREKDRLAMEARLAAQDKRDEEKEQAFKAAELLRIKRDEKLARDRLQRNVLRREEHERTKAYFAPIFHAERFLLEPRPSTVDKDWKAMSFS